jgi:dTDP-4-amino-4,6-dideoxygalactose transaminase
MFGMSDKMLYNKAMHHMDKFDTRPMFYRITDLPPYREYSRKNPIARLLSKNAFMLPSYPTLTNNQIDSICKDILDD